MFSDSEIAASYSMSESKFRYVTTFGLGPYFAKKLFYDVKQSPAHALLFDESLNEEMQSKQLDVHVRYWSSENDRVESRYLTSLFIGHGRTDDILTHFDEATKDLDPVKTWNIGMDGPNVNLAFEREPEKSREELNLPSLLNLGICGLHTVHRSFQTGAKETNWDLDQYLLKVPLKSNSQYPFFYIFVHNKSFQKILPNFKLLRTSELTFFGPLFLRIYGCH